MREYLKRENAHTEASEASVRETTPYNRENFEQRMTGYTPNPGEREERGEPRELFSMRNSYNDVSIGADRKGDMMVTGSAVRRHDAPTVKQDEKRVEGARRKKLRTRGGEFFTNPAKPEESAFAYRVGKKMPERKVLGQLRDAARRHDLNTFNDTLAFLDLKKDEDRLRALRDAEAPSAEIQALEGVVMRKKALEAKFLRNLRLARREISSLDLDELREKLFGETKPQLFVTPEQASGEDAGGDDETAENTDITEND